MMRIITGTARGTKLETLDSDATRPTTERVKEALFSMIQFEIAERSVLDLFGGSGQLALEAISRGAKSACICDSNPDAVKIIKRNAQKTHLFEKCVVLNTDAMRMIANSKEKFDIIFLDPPYRSELVKDALKALDERDLIAPAGLVICETAAPLEYVPETLNVRREAKYSRSYITVLEKESED